MSIRNFIVDDVRGIWRRWSFRSGAVTVVLLVAVPVIDDHWPDLAPVLVSVFPAHGRQVAPIAGVLIAIAAQCIRQAAVLDAIKRFFRKQPDQPGGTKQ
ncbi:hypothetical protein [Burkholderia gladioli]|uniref:hypothetical protein n=1 Tax=Burkholderia gladioli TaxID=28095 RepID=UPI00163F6C53|nr:hypothetical protein [Burkholderia gladioli]